MIGYLYMSQMALLWPTVGSDDDESECCDSDSEMSRTEEQVRITQTPIQCIAKQRKVQTIGNEKVPTTIQVLSTDGKTPQAILVTVFDRQQVIDVGVLVFLKLKRQLEGQAGKITTAEELKKQVMSQGWTIVSNHMKIEAMKDCIRFEWQSVYGAASVDVLANTDLTNLNAE